MSVIKSVAVQIKIILVVISCFFSAASVKSVKSEKDLPIPSVGEAHGSHHLGHHMHHHQQQMPKGPSRHLVYATHLPISQVHFRTVVTHFLAGRSSLSRTQILTWLFK